jgi:hypothetical protein
MHVGLCSCRSTPAGAVAVLAGYALGFPAVVMAVFRGRLRRWRPGAAFLGGETPDILLPGVSPPLIAHPLPSSIIQWATT